MARFDDSPNGDARSRRQMPFSPQFLIVRRAGKYWECRHEDFGKTTECIPNSVHQFVIGFGTSANKAIRNWQSQNTRMYLALYHATNGDRTINA